MNKEELRKYYLNKRRSLSSEDIQSASEGICTSLFDNFEFKSGDSVHVFLPILSQNEINTYPIIDNLHQQGITTVVPVTDFKSKTMTSVLFEKGQETRLNKGIPEPIVKNRFDDQILTHILIPLAIFDKKGYRIGYGGGFYDRFLPKTNSKVQKIGLSAFKPVDNCKPNEFDIPLNHCITPQKKYSF